MTNLFTRCVRVAAVVLFLATWVAISTAAEGGRASGTFQGRDISMKVADAYAFYGSPSLGGKEKVIVVAVSNSAFIKNVIDKYWDRKSALDRFFKDENTGLVYFEFDRKGRYRGLSYYFGPGNGCSYCADPAVASTVLLKNNKMSGKLSFPKGNDPNRWFDVSIDVAISSDDHGKPQGAGGGEPGKAYIAYHKALMGNDQNRLKPVLAAERRAAWKKAEAEGRGADFIAFLHEEHPKEARVPEAFIDGDHALVLLEGTGGDGKVRGEARMIREQGAWRFEEETVNPAN